MIEIIAIVCATMVFTMAKKQQMPVFGQMTLTGEKALDWVKNPTEIIASKIWFCNVNALSDWNVPEWAKEKGIVALIFPIDEWGNPVFVTQKSILKVLEIQCAKWESEGAKCKTARTSGGGLRSEIVFEENHPRFKFSKADDARQFDPYMVEING